MEKNGQMNSKNSINLNGANHYENTNQAMKRMSLKRPRESINE